ALRGHDVTVYAPQATEIPRPPGTKARSIGHGRAPNTPGGAWDLLTFGTRASMSIMRHQRNAVAYGPLGSVLVPGVVTAHSVHAAWVRDRGRAVGGPGASVFDRGLIATERIAYHLPYLRYTTVSALCADDIAECFGVDRDRVTVIAPAIDP